MVSDHEVRREARRVFKRLLEPGAHLRDLTGYLATKGQWGLFSARNGFTRPVAKLEPDIVEAFISNDWLNETGDRHQELSPSGAAWYRRIKAQAEPFASQHRDSEPRVLESDGRREVVQVNAAESPLAWLRARSNPQGEPMLTEEQYEAGERLRRDFEQARLRQHVTANWDMRATGSRRSRGAPAAEPIADRAIAARQRYNRALDAVGPELASVLIEVCCNLNGLSDAELALGWPKRSGKVVLLIALNTLVRHYDASPARHPVRTELQHWGADNYRPAIAPDAETGASE